MKTFAFLAAAAASLLAHGTARADDHSTALDRAGRGLGWYGYYLRDMHKFGTNTPDTSLLDPKDCYAVIDQYKDEIAGDETISSIDFKVLDWAKEVPNSGSPPQFAIRFDTAKKLCETYADLRATITAAKPLEEVYQALDVSAIVDDSYESLDWYLIATGKIEIDDSASKKLAKKCNDAVDTALAAGARGDVPIKFGRTKDMTLEELRADCETRLSGGAAHAAKVKKWAKDKYDSIAAVYKAVGIKGDRLDLFIYYHGEWYLPGCTSSTDDPKKLKKAKKLFQWLTASDGTITIRKFTFKGDKYKVSEKQYLREDKAYKGCK